MAFRPYHQCVRVWGSGLAALLAAAVAGLVTWAALDAAIRPPTAAAPPARPVLETVAPAQLAAMGLRLDPTAQPLDVPAWMTSAGIRLPSMILARHEAEQVVRSNSGGVHGVVEARLTYATTAPRGVRLRSPAVVHRLVWAVVGTRLGAAGMGRLVRVLWLVDAHTGRQLFEMTVPASGLLGGPPPLPAPAARARP